MAGSWRRTRRRDSHRLSVVARHFHHSKGKKPVEDEPHSFHILKYSRRSHVVRNWCSSKMKLCLFLAVSVSLVLANEGKFALLN